MNHESEIQTRVRLEAENVGRSFRYPNGSEGLRIDEDLSGGLTPRSTRQLQLDEEQVGFVGDGGCVRLALDDRECGLGDRHRRDARSMVRRVLSLTRW